MSIFSSIVSKIFGHPSAPAVATPAATPKPEVIIVDGSQATAGIAPPARNPEPVAAPPAAPVDVAAVLGALAAQKGGKSDWQHSIVDLLKLLDLDSSFGARKELATELGCPADKMADSAAMNTWLHKAVLQKLAANGGNIPKELL